MEEATKIWMRVSNDEFQLPLAVADSAIDLAKICGTSPAVTYSQISQCRAGKLKFCPWVCIVVCVNEEAMGGVA